MIKQNLSIYLCYNWCHCLPLYLHLLCPYGAFVCIVVGAEEPSQRNMYESHYREVSGCSTKANKHSHRDDKSKNCFCVLYFRELRVLCICFVSQ